MLITNKKKFDIQVYRYLDKSLESIWKKLEEEIHPHVFQSYEWVHHWYETVAKDKSNYRLLVVVVSSSNEPLALIPLSTISIFGTKILQFLGESQSDYNEPLISQRCAAYNFNEIWSSVLLSLPHHDLRYFIRVPKKLNEDANLFLNSVVNPKFHVFAYSATLPKSWPEYYEILPKRFRKDNERLKKRLEELGGIEMIIAENQKLYNEIIRETFTQKELQFKDTGARNFLKKKEIRNFYSEMFKLKDGGIKTHLSALKFNNKIIATHLGVEYQNVFYYLLPTFSRGEMKKYSPGRLLLEKLINISVDKKLIKFDFTTGAESYKKIWCDSEMMLYYSLEAITFRGKVYKFALKFIHWIKHNPRMRSIFLRIFSILG